MSYGETIVARCSAPGAGVRGIIRLSGPDTLRALTELTGQAFSPVPVDLPRVVDLPVYPWDPTRPVPAKLFFWPEGRGYTREQSAEIHTISSPPILEALTSRLCQSEGCRLARPGEFTMRAFLAGRLDLTRAEAVLGIIDAPSARELETALRQLAGGVALPVREIREELLETLAHLEAGFDFIEEDIEFVSLAEVRRLLDDALDRVRSLRERMDERHLSRERPKVVLVGPPNAGKSTLFNALLDRDYALVSTVAGTTRDYLEAEADFEGLTVLLIDTAGLDSEIARDEIDVRAQQETGTVAGQADLVLYCTNDKERPPVSAALPMSRTLFVRTKSDLTVDAVFTEDGFTAVSAVTGQGLNRLRAAITERLKARFRGGDVVPNTALRCREFLTEAQRTLEQTLEEFDGNDRVFDESLLASEIRTAAGFLGLVDGTVHTDDLLDRIFSRFCIGK